MKFLTLLHAHRPPSRWALSLFFASLSLLGAVVVVAVLSIPWLSRGS